MASKWTANVKAKADDPAGPSTFCLCVLGNIMIFTPIALYPEATRGKSQKAVPAFGYDPVGLAKRLFENGCRGLSWGDRVIQDVDAPEPRADGLGHRLILSQPNADGCKLD
jgi:hypothetical protein